MHAGEQPLERSTAEDMLTSSHHFANPQLQDFVGTLARPACRLLLGIIICNLRAQFSCAGISLVAVVGCRSWKGWENCHFLALTFTPVFRSMLPAPKFGVIGLFLPEHLSICFGNSPRIQDKLSRSWWTITPWY